MTATALTEMEIKEPALVHGESLDQPTFHRRYEQMPEDVRAELIGGIVYVMSSPVSPEHGIPVSRVDRWLGVFEEASPGTEISIDTTTILGPRSEPQPDVYLRILPEFGGRSHRHGRGYPVGPPELLVEVGISTASFDLNQRKRDYEQAGVQEYVVVLATELRWFRLVEGKYQPLLPGEDGILRSVVFPGLWLNPTALLSGDMRRVRQVARQGIRTGEHRAWVKDLRKQKQP